MEKANHPTSEYKVSCDVFDTSLGVKFHEAKGYTKLQLQMKVKDSDEEISLSLFKEDVKALSNFLAQAAEYTDQRNHE